MAPKMKRRDSDEAYDEFFEFSLSSPATKIRRLDAEVAPIAEKDGEPFEIEEAMGDSSLDLSPSMNEERAIVLYRPMDSHLLLGPDRSNVSSLQISSDLILGLENGLFERVKVGSAVDDRRTAVIPWAHVSAEAAEAAMVAEEAASMEVEAEEEEDDDDDDDDDEGKRKGRGEQVNISNGGVAGERLHPWQWQWQNHCMEPQLQQQQQQQLLLNTTTPMMWSW